MSLDNQGTLQRYADLQAIDDPKRADEAQRKIAAMSKIDLDAHWVHSRKAGDVFIMEDRNGTELAILEWVISRGAGDACATLYKPHALFNTLGEYQTARETLLDDLCDLADAPAAGVAIMDPVRKRVTHLRELGFMQLLDIARAQVNKFNGRVGH